eukprot:12893287-Prorocentrum_lima.AAC.1
MFGGLARLAQVHHVCMRPHPDELAQVSNADVNVNSWDRDAPILVDLGKAKQVLREALAVVADGPPPCE